MLKVLSLFDGISCGRVALERAGLDVERYVAFENDPDAINVSAWNWPDIEHKGDIEGADFTPYIGFDLVIGGFPCTDLSIGKNGREGLKGKASRLFWEQVRAIEVVKPKYFLVENNYGMPKKDEAIITETLGVDPIYINSALVSGQNRKRLYWTNIPRVEAPEDRGILLRDVLEENPALKYYISDSGINYMCEGDKNGRNGFQYNYFSDSSRGKSKCILANFSKGTPYNVLAVDVSKKVADLAQGAQSGRVYDVNAKSVCLQSGGGGMGANTGLYALALRTRNTDQGRFKKPEVQLTGKANAITTVQSDSMVIMTKGGGVARLLGRSWTIALQRSGSSRKAKRRSLRHSQANAFRVRALADVTRPLYGYGKRYPTVQATRQRLDGRRNSAYFQLY